mmetsp:Transcript_18544/g.30501  ORF Transcript_18544/g.30501 Transcript_18544/m.30501 type:complete len:137 (-) Transcript_18544:108-518(-)
MYHNVLLCVWIAAMWAVTSWLLLDPKFLRALVPAPLTQTFSWYLWGLAWADLAVSVAYARFVLPFLVRRIPHVRDFVKYDMCMPMWSGIRQQYANYREKQRDKDKAEGEAHGQPALSNTDTMTSDTTAVAPISIQM